jgi:hypothetical protein
MAIITSFLKGERYGLLGPQLAGTIIEQHTPCQCIVIAVARDDDKAVLEKSLGDYFGGRMPVIGFTALSGRPDLYEFAGELKSKGAVTLLAGPQAAVDFSGEVGWKEHPHRFRGVSDRFSFALQGPAEQLLPLFISSGHKDPRQIPGLVYRSEDDRFFQNPASPWSEKFFGRVDWNRLYTTSDGGLTPLPVEMGQVLQHIGCPHAARQRKIEIDYPALLHQDAAKKVRIGMRGCSFCDVAADKGFHAKLGLDAVVSQIDCLPGGADGRRIPFELIDESPLPGLAELLEEVEQRCIPISQVNLTLRADWLAAGGDRLRQALQTAHRMDARILLSSIGFESFDDTILKNLNKGLTREKNLAAVRLIRRLKEDFPHQLGYTSGEGAIHGFIHPTPWDSNQTEATIQKTIALYGLQQDILPPHSTPLIIHHASALGEWIREIERRENLKYKRHGSIIAWWDPPSETSG